MQYTDCNDLLGTPGDPSTYRSAMAINVAQAYAHTQGPGIGRNAVLPGDTGTLVPPGTPATIGCATGLNFPATTVETVVYEYTESLTASGPAYYLTSWDYAVPTGALLGSAAVGHVDQQTIPAGALPDCMTSSDPTWN
jgi:hypothetical protein